MSTSLKNVLNMDVVPVIKSWLKIGWQWLTVNPDIHDDKNMWAALGAIRFWLAFG